jgi:hypothetical protein
VTDDFDHQVRQALRRRRRAPRVLLSVSVLAVIAAAAAYLWLNYAGLVHEISFAEHRAAAPVVDSAEETVPLKDFQSFQRQITETLQSAAQDIAAQKADLKNLSDQMSALAAKIDALQGGAPPTGSFSAPVEARPGPQQAAPARPTVVGAQKKPPAPKTTGPISVGGAPLPPAPPADR